MKHTYIHTHNIERESERFGYGSVGWGFGLVWYGVCFILFLLYLISVLIFWLMVFLSPVLFLFFSFSSPLVLFPLLCPYTNITYCKCVHPIELFMRFMYDRYRLRHRL